MSFGFFYGFYCVKMFPADGLLLIFVNGVVEKVVIRLYQLEDADGLVEPVVLVEEVVVEVGDDVEVFGAEVVGVGEVFGKSARDVFELLFANGGEDLFEGFVFYYFSEFVCFINDGLAHSSHQRSRKTPDSAGEQACVGLDVEVVTAVQRFLPMRIDKGTEVAFVGGFVGRETYVSIDAVGTVFHVEAGCFRLELGDSVNKALYDFVELLLSLLVSRLVGCEPFTVVVCGYLF